MQENDLVLTTQDLALLRASLRYWIDEMHDDRPESVAAYFGSANEAEAVQPGQPRRLLSTLQRCQLRYLLLNSGDPVSGDESLFEVPAEADQFRLTDQRVATMLACEGPKLLDTSGLTVMALEEIQNAESTNEHKSSWEFG